MHIVNVNERHADLIIEATGHYVEHGNSVDVPEEVAEQLLQQEGEWARPTTKVAKAAEKTAAKNQRKAEDAEPDSKETA